MSIPVFLNHYHLREQPFGVTPDPRFLLDTPSHREAWATLLYGLESGRGFIGLIAPPGLGKTTLLFRLLENLRGRARTAFLFHTQCDSDQFLAQLLAELDDGAGAGDPAGVRADGEWQALAEQARSVTHADGAAIALHENGALVCVGSTGPAPPVGARGVLDTGISGECFRTGKIISCADAEQEVRIPAAVREMIPCKSILTMPIRAGGSVIGLVEVLSYRGSAFGDAARAALQPLVDTAGLRARPPVASSKNRVPSGADRAAMHDAINDILVRDAATGVQPVLIVDEAQNLSDSVLETIRLLSDFETSRAKLLQVVLAGQTELGRRLASPGLVQLRQRISLMSQLTPLSGLEVRTYIEHRLRVAGHTGAPLFTPRACDAIAALSGGIPRDINNICFQAMSLACASDRAIIDRDIVAEVATDLNWGKVDSVPGAHNPPARVESAETTPANARPFFEKPENRTPVAQIPVRVRYDRPQTAAALLATTTPVAQIPVRAPHDRPRTAAAVPATTAPVIQLPVRAPVRSPDERPQSAATVSAVDAGPVRATSRPQHVSKPAHRNDPSTAVLAMGVAVVVLMFGALWHYNLLALPSSSDAPAQSASASTDRAGPQANQAPKRSKSSRKHASAAARPAAVPAAPAPPPQSTATVPAPPSLESSSGNLPSSAVVNFAHTTPATSLPSATAAKVSDGDLITMVPPAYPAPARTAHIEGDVVLSATVAKDGTVKDVRVVSGDPALVPAAIAAVKRRRYAPSRMNGQPEQVQKEITVKFTLAGSS